MSNSIFDKPMAAPGLTSYRCKSQYVGWIMIGARSHEEALSEARRSDETRERCHIQVWNGSAYEDIE